MSFEGYPPGLGAMHAHEALRGAVLNAAVIVAATLVVRRIGPRTA